MADRTIKKFSSVPATTTDTFNSGVIPAGKKLYIIKIGGADLNTGDNKSSLFVVQFGSGAAFDEIAVFTATGSAYEFDVKEELLGDGVKFLRLTRQNNSAVAKRIMLWVKGYDA